MFAIPDSAFRAAYAETGIRPARELWLDETTEIATGKKIRCGCPLGVLIYKLVGEEQANYICGNDDFRRMAEILNHYHYPVTPHELRAFVSGLDGGDFNNRGSQMTPIVDRRNAYQAGERIYEEIIAPLTPVS